MVKICTYYLCALHVVSGSMYTPILTEEEEMAALLLSSDGSVPGYYFLGRGFNPNQGHSLISGKKSFWGIPYIALTAFCILHGMVMKNG